ncbi:PREDICTED: uncharacterized protein LOC104621114, partial [Phaethon lepturus]|uniref:uncharacterized protein LOC104621114 n=1 Tax=Phaethon lepturus TaxID=97097 RepID=UPI000530A235
DVSTEKHRPIMTIGINRPEASNAANQETAALFLLMFNTFEVYQTLYSIMKCLESDLKSVSQARKLLVTLSAEKQMTGESWTQSQVTPSDRAEALTVRDLKVRPYQPGVIQGSSCSHRGRAAALTWLGYAGGNFCAGYDLKVLAHNPTSVKLEQHVAKGPGPMIEATKDAHKAASLHCSLADARAMSVPVHQAVPPYVARSWDWIIRTVERSRLGHYFGLGQ